MGNQVSPYGTEFNGVARTARWTAASRARESRRPDRLFNDPFADLLAGPDGHNLLSHFHTSHGADDGNPFLPIRTRWFDDFLTGATEGPTHQAVCLGAGLDTRAFRLDWPPGTVLYELDQPAVLHYKNARLETAGEPSRCERRTVPVDFADGWTTDLQDAGYDPTRPTVWFGEGLLFYLTQEAARATLTQAARLSAPGSRLAVDLIGTGIFRFPYMRPFLRKLEEAGSPWSFGTDDPGGFVEECGWSVTELSEPGSPKANYGRWPEQAGLSGIADLPRSFLVAAAIPARRA